MLKRGSTVLLGILMASALAGCRKGEAVPVAKAAPEPVLKAAPATPIEEAKEELGGKTWDPQWDVIVEKVLPADLLSPAAAHAVRSFCPNFQHEAEADKRAFWAYFFQALAGAEAGLDPTTTVHHTQAVMQVKDSQTGRPIKQQGLLQLAYEDGDRYGCDFDWPADRKLPEKDPRRTILEPANNLACGIRIIENQIIKQHKPLIVRTSYWSTLQPGTMSYRVFAKQMANTPPACGVGVLKPKARHARPVAAAADAPVKPEPAAKPEQASSPRL